MGIPTVLDRLIQQAIAQVLTPMFEAVFSPYSYGFRPGRSAHQAVQKSQEYIREGYDWVVDIDLEKFFDRVNHDMLTLAPHASAGVARVARVVKDKRVLKLIRAYLNSGVMLNGVVVETGEGTPQGGPLSPLLSNIMLSDLDRELEEHCETILQTTLFLLNRRMRTRMSGGVRGGRLITAPYSIFSGT